MRRIISVLLITVLLLSLFATAFAAGDSGDMQGIHWEIDKKGILTFTGKGAVPETGPWLQYAKTASQLVFGEGITEINCSFSDFAGLTSITFGPDLTKLKWNLFRSRKQKKLVLQMKKDCFTALSMDLRLSRPTEVEIDENSCYVLENGLVMTKDHKTVVYYAGKGKVEIPDGVQTIRESAFEKSQISEVSFPDTLTTIGASSFYNCDKLQKLVFPKSLVKLADHAVSSCNSLKEVIFYNGAMAGDKENSFFEAFGNTALTHVELPPMNIVSSFMFQGCRNLKTAAIGEGTQRISYGVFENCKSLTALYIPASVTSIDEKFFDYSSKLTIYCPAGSYAETFAHNYGYDCAPLNYVSGITLSESGITLKKGKTAPITATLEPTDATVQTMTWYSSNEAVATINKGKIKAVSPGECDIVCASMDGSGIFSVCHVTVE